MTQPKSPKWDKTRTIATSFLEIPTDLFPESIPTKVNQMRNVQEAELTDLENQMQQAEFASCHLINVEKAFDSLLLKHNNKMKVWKNYQMN